MSTFFARLAHSSAVHFGFAFVAMGSWAAFANRAHPMPAPLYAGLIQGALSGCITLFLKRLVAYLGTKFAGLAALLAPPAIAGAVSASLLTTIHAVGGTPEIARTVALPLTVATSYAAIYNFSLRRAGKSEKDGKPQ
jgi:mannose/fructose/N-acetylgalactosamine-specific phosphotransferase system component IIC